MDFARLLIRNETNVFGGPSSGTVFDLTDACPKCGTGAVQVGPLLLSRPPRSQRDIFSTLDGELLVEAALSARLQKQGVACLAEVIDARTGVPMDLRQFKPQATLPPFSAATRGYARERPCQACDRDGFFANPAVPLELRYDSLPQGNFQLFATFERFGNSRLREPFRDSVFAAPLLVAAGELVHALAAAAVPGLELHPVVIRDRR